VFSRTETSTKRKTVGKVNQSVISVGSGEPRANQRGGGGINAWGQKEKPRGSGLRSSVLGEVGDGGRIKKKKKKNLSRNLYFGRRCTKTDAARTMHRICALGYEILRCEAQGEGWRGQAQKRLVYFFWGMETKSPSGHNNR